MAKKTKKTVKKTTKRKPATKKVAKKKAAPKRKPAKKVQPDKRACLVKEIARLKYSLKMANNDTDFWNEHYRRICDSLGNEKRKARELEERLYEVRGELASLRCDVERNMVSRVSYNELQREIDELIEAGDGLAIDNLKMIKEMMDQDKKFDKLAVIHARKLVE